MEPAAAARTVHDPEAASTGAVAERRSSNPLARRVRAQIAEHGGGPYGVGVLGWFVVLETLDLYGIWLATGGLAPFFERLLSGLLGFGIDSFMNGFKAMIWPLEVIERFGVPGLVLLGVVLSVGVFGDDGHDDDDAGEPAP